MNLVTEISFGVAVLAFVIGVVVYITHGKAMAAWYKAKVPSEVQVLLQQIVAKVEQDLGTATGQEKFEEAVARAQDALAAMGINLPLVAIEAGVQMAYNLLVQARLLSVTKPAPVPAPAPTPAPAPAPAPEPAPAPAQ